MFIGEQIRKYRSEMGISQKELGANLGVSQAMIAQYENGKRTPKIETQQKIANALNVPLYELMGFDGSIRVNTDSERERLDEEAQKIIIKQNSGEEITEEETQKVSDFIQRTTESYDRLSKSIKDCAEIIGRYLNENTQKSKENVQVLKEKLQTLIELTPTMPDFYENLNDIGRKKAADYISDLSNIPEYQKKLNKPPKD